MNETSRRPYRVFGSWVRSRRLARRWTQEELARRLDYDVTYVRKIEWGERRASDPLRVRLAQVLAVPVASLPPSDPQAPNRPNAQDPLIGRASDMANVVGLFERGARLVTLLGAPGIGKTRLAMALGSHFDERLEGGARFVALVEVPDAIGVPQAIGRAIGVPLPAVGEEIEQLADGLRGQEMLLVLDNFEHVAEAAGAVGALLARAASLRMLVTSRQGLNLESETHYVLPPLALPDSVEGPVEQLMDVAAIALFVARTKRVRPDFQLDHANAAAVAEICTRLEGIPLAIELAAGAAKFLTPKALLAQLGNGLDLPVPARSHVPEHHATLRAAIGWSFELLGPYEYILMSRLAVFAGGFTLEAASIVCCLSRDRAGSVGAGVLTLADKSLVEPVVDGGGGSRFVLRDAIRTFALERLAASGERDRFEARHASWALELVAASERRITGGDQVAALAELEAEHSNLRAALRWTLKHDPPAATRLCAGLWRFWWMRGHLAEGRQWLDAALGESDAAEPAYRLALAGAGVLARTQGAYETAGVLLDACVASSREFGDQQALALALINLGILAEHTGDDGRAAALFDEANQLYAAIGDSRGVGHTLNCLANVRLAERDLDGSTRLFEEALALFRRTGDDWSTAMVLANLGWVAHKQGRNALACSLYEQALAAFRALGDELGVANGLLNLGIASHAAGVDEGVTGLFEEALLSFSRLGERRAVAECLEALATVKAVEDQRGAAVLLGAADALRKSIGAPLRAEDQDTQSRVVEAIGAALGPTDFDIAWQCGRSVEIDDVVASVLGTEGRLSGRAERLTMD